LSLDALGFIVLEHVGNFVKHQGKLAKRLHVVLVTLSTVFSASRASAGCFIIVRASGFTSVERSKSDRRSANNWPAAGGAIATGGRVEITCDAL
jgi:hypothetical protein